LEILDPIGYPEWDDLLLSSPGYSFFHTSFWARVLCDSYDYRPHYLTRIHDNKLDVLVPVMEVRSFLTGRRGVSLPFTDYCEPIISDHGNRQDMLAFLKAHGEREKWKYLELRGGADLLGKVPFSSFYYRHILQLSTDVDTIYAHLKSSTKRNIRKAVREDVVVTRSNTLEAVITYYKLHCLTRKKHGFPPQPFLFFQRIFDHIISRDHGQVALADYQGKTIAGAVYLHFGNEAIYKFGASDCRFLHLRPNDLLMWETIQWYCRNGYTRFCFGRTDPDNEGLRQFKNGWGAEEKVIRYFKYDVNRKEFKTEKPSNAAISTMIFRRMPIFFSRLVGRALYRHVG
jgi:hypothetical protein